LKFNLGYKINITCYTSRHAIIANKIQFTGVIVFGNSEQFKGAMLSLLLLSNYLELTLNKALIIATASHPAL